MGGGSNFHSIMSQILHGLTGGASGKTAAPTAASARRSQTARKFSYQVAVKLLTRSSTLRPPMVTPECTTSPQV